MALTLRGYTSFLTLILVCQLLDIVWTWTLYQRYPLSIDDNWWRHYMDHLTGECNLQARNRFSMIWRHQSIAYVKETYFVLQVSRSYRRCINERDWQLRSDFFFLLFLCLLLLNHMLMIKFLRDLQIWCKNR